MHPKRLREHGDRERRLGQRVLQQRVRRQPLQVSRGQRSRLGSRSGTANGLSSHCARAKLIVAPLSLKSNVTITCYTVIIRSTSMVYIIFYYRPQRQVNIITLKNILICSHIVCEPSRAMRRRAQCVDIEPLCFITKSMCICRRRFTERFFQFIGYFILPYSYF